MFDTIRGILIEELTSLVPNEVGQFAEAIADRLKHRPLGILFYGSILREVDPDGILDFYVITDRPSSLNENPLASLANHILPPNVYYMEHVIGGQLLRAKVAFLSQRQFQKRSTIFTLDTTIWARFCQPVRMVWVRDNKSADHVLQAIRQCAITASCWAALLGPEEGMAIDYWHNLFAHTYAVEFRVEKKGRSHHLLQGREERYIAVLESAWQHVSLGYEIEKGGLRPLLTTSVRMKAEKNWQKIQAVGRPLNLARLVKAAFTFKDGVSYLLWKIQRHTGEKIHVSSFEKKHPILTLPLFLWRARYVRLNRKSH
ncbi:hypothetical protein NQF87_02135 [Bombella sp. TMW 2.2559]|uniref:Phosphatidate cytidylyltransferase n=1 Tax=Bombella dulcis TaxID=2967339 RepID=A0ABT3WBX6_9PROT|nr:hypothetical protein [Bombella dulcis]MCX5615780.1 hypothetical protein [Bombella dulcis]